MVVAGGSESMSRMPFYDYSDRPRSSKTWSLPNGAAFSEHLLARSKYWKAFVLRNQFDLVGVEPQKSQWLNVLVSVYFGRCAFAERLQ